MIIELIHYLTVSAIVAITAIGVSIGQGIINLTAIKAINIQPAAKDDIGRISLLCTTLTETSAILATITAIVLLVTVKSFSIAEMCVALAIVPPGFLVGLLASMPAKEACLSVARQPFFSKKIQTLAFLTVSLLQTPIIFGFIVALFLIGQVSTVSTTPDFLRLLGCSISIGLGGIGPTIGIAKFAKIACQSIGINRKSYNQIFSFTLISEAIIDTPFLFALVISLLLLNIFIPINDNSLTTGIALLMSGICITLGTLGAGLGSGSTAATACKQISSNPDIYPYVSKASMFSQVMIDTCAVCAMVISMLLVMVV